METAPRRKVETDPLRRIMDLLGQIRKDVDGLQRTSSLRNASISGGDGLQILDEDGTLQAQISPDRTVTVFDSTGAPVVRMGTMFETGPEPYGIEVRVGVDSWVQLGSQSVAWENVAAKPSTFPPDTHTHPGNQVTSAVANATEAAHAALADGSEYGFNNTVSGTQFYALWVGNDGGFHLGRNTSSMKYKMNIRDAGLDPRRVLNLRPVIYDRRPNTTPLPDGVEGPAPQYPGARDEFGLIAEETNEHVPEVVTWFDGEIDGIRYELLPVAMIPLLQEHDRDLRDLRAENEKLRQAIINMGGVI